MATLGLNLAPFLQNLDAAQGQAKQKGESIGSALGEELTGKLAALGSGIALEEYARRTIEWADALADLSIRTGLSVEQLQVLESIGSKTGVSVQSLASLYERLGKAMAIAHKGGAAGAETGEALSRLGVTDQTLASGDMGAAMAEVAAHLRSAGEITPQLEADLAKVYKNAREAIPALKGMSEDAVVFAQTTAVSVEHMAAMKGASDNLKDIWHLISSAGKSFVGELAYGFQTVIGNLSAIPAWGARLFETGSLEKANTAAITQLRKVAADRANLEKELSGQKPSKDPYGDVMDKAAERKETKEEAAERHLDEIRAKSADRVQKIHEQIAEIQRKASMDGMSADEKRAAIAQEIAKLKKERDPYGEATDEEIALKDKEIAQRESDLAGIKHNTAKARSIAASPGLAAGGMLLGGLGNPLEDANLNVAKKSEGHLANIRKGIERLSSASRAQVSGAFDGTQF